MFTWVKTALIKDANSRSGVVWLSYKIDFFSPLFFTDSDQKIKSCCCGSKMRIALCCVVIGILTSMSCALGAGLFGYPLHASCRIQWYVTLIIFSPFVIVIVLCRFQLLCCWNDLRLCWLPHFFLSVRDIINGNIQALELKTMPLIVRRSTK